MIWHIFKKDLRLVWPMAVVVGLAQFLTAGLLSFHGQFERGVSDYSQYGWLSNDVLPVICLLGIVILAVAVVQQDRLPGATQDWLTRPIPRGQLLAAKMVFILVIGLGPVLVSDVAGGILEHLRLRDVLAASLTRTLVLYGVVCLPALLIGIVTRSLTEALVFTLAVVVILGVETTVLAQTGLQAPVTGSGFAWTILLALLVMNAVAVTVLLPVQLRWRGTNRVRWIAAGYLCVAPTVIVLPWGAAFGLQQAVAGHGPQPAFAVGIDANRKVTFAAENAGRSVVQNPSQVSLALPVSVLASGPNQVWQLDYATVRLIDPTSGYSLVSTHAYMTGDHYSPRGRSERLVASFPVELFHAAQARRAKVSATLFMTTYRLEASKSIVLLSHGSIDEFSRCGLGYGDVARCISTRPVGTCIDIVNMEATGRRVWPGFACRTTSYAPWPLPLWRDPYFTFVLPSDSPISQDEKDARVLRNYAPNAHFIRGFEFALSEATEGSPGREPKSRDGAGTAARFAAPTGMTADSHGNVFVVDQVDSIVRKVTPSGEVTTFAGRAGQAGRGDGQGSEALFDHPAGIAADAEDNLYVADTGNVLVRKISPVGLVTTVAGSTGPASGGLRLIHPTGVVCTRDGSVYVIDHNVDNSAVVLKVLPGGVLKAIAGPDAQPLPDEQPIPTQVVIEDVTE
ncbi:MAG: hypothetical protein JO184_09825 [Gammaproteobacteria bacterium]|nr:hypothetical protein [Gammaproteobacteria bacterium]